MTDTVLPSAPIVTELSPAVTLTSFILPVSSVFAASILLSTDPATAAAPLIMSIFPLTAAIASLFVDTSLLMSVTDCCRWAMSPATSPDAELCASFITVPSPDTMYAPAPYVVSPIVSVDLTYMIWPMLSAVARPVASV